IIPFYGVYFVYKSTAPNKGKWWAVSIIVTLVTFNIIFGGTDKNSDKNKTDKNQVSKQVDEEKKEEEKEVVVKLEDNIKFLSCNCSIGKKKTRDGVYSSGVQILAPKYEKILKCKAVMLNQNEKKIDTDFSLTWELKTKTGASIETISSQVGEYLPPKLKVTWEKEEEFRFQKEKLDDISKRLSKTECSLENLKTVD
ncbi:MAG: hypothetical protein JJT78_03965, partial [Leptospira sp.]|nr:hypothetical protein [Leptospira sp.]